MAVAAEPFPIPGRVDDTELLLARVHPSEPTELFSELLLQV